MSLDEAGMSPPLTPLRFWFPVTHILQTYPQVMAGLHELLGQMDSSRAAD